MKKKINALSLPELVKFIKEYEPPGIVESWLFRKRFLAVMDEAFIGKEDRLMGVFQEKYKHRDPHRESRFCMRVGDVAGHYRRACGCGPWGSDLI